MPYKTPAPPPIPGRKTFFSIYYREVGKTIWYPYNPAQLYSGPGSVRTTMRRLENEFGPDFQFEALTHTLTIPQSLTTLELQVRSMKL
jgi:hypothetical protein